MAYGTNAVRVIYQVELDRADTATSQVFARDHEGPWPFPNLPAPGDAVVIDYDFGGHAAEQRGEVTEITPTPGRRLSARLVERVTYRPAGPHVLLHLSVDGLAGDPEEQVQVLREAGFQERP
jgi:hypothetical protein